jgi:hypothetical protein
MEPTKEQLATLENWSRSLFVKIAVAIAGLVGVGLAAYLPKEPLVQGLLLACAGLLTLSTWLALRLLQTRLNLSSVTGELSRVLAGPPEPELSQSELSILSHCADNKGEGFSQGFLMQELALSDDDVEEALERLFQLKFITQDVDDANYTNLDSYRSTRTGRRYVEWFRSRTSQPPPPGSPF